MSAIWNILNKIPAEKEKRKKMQIALKKQFEKYGKNLVIYGHGNLGKELQKELENADWHVQYFLDANQPTDLSKKNINLADAKWYIAPDAIIVVAIYNIYVEYSAICGKLQTMWFQNIISVLDLRAWPELFQAGHIHSALSWDVDHIPKEAVCDAYDLLEDSLSKKVYREVMEFFVSDERPHFKLCPAQNQYMPDTVYSPAENELSTRRVQPIGRRLLPI